MYVYVYIDICIHTHIHSAAILSSSVIFGLSFSFRCARGQEEREARLGWRHQRPCSWVEYQLSAHPSLRMVLARTFSPVVCLNPKP